MPSRLTSAPHMSRSNPPLASCLADVNADFNDEYSGSFAHKSSPPFCAGRALPAIAANEYDAAMAATQRDWRMVAFMSFSSCLVAIVGWMTRLVRIQRRRSLQQKLP